MSSGLLQKSAFTPIFFRRENIDRRSQVGLRTPLADGLSTKPEPHRRTGFTTSAALQDRETSSLGVPSLRRTKRHVRLAARAGTQLSGTEEPKDPTQTEAAAQRLKADSGAESDEEVSALMEGVTFAQLCDDFECVSSPAVERTARLLARDIHDIKEDKRSLSCFAVDVQYQDPLRSFKGREKYRRTSWILNGLDQPRVSMIGMEMQGTSVLVIIWRLRGSFRSLPGANTLGAALDVLVTSTFTLNQISGQVTNHKDEWDLSRSPPQAALLFYTSRLAWAVVQASKDLSEGAASAGSLLDKVTGKKDSNFYYPDPSGDPRKFFTQDDPNKELYQFAFAVALLYLVVQFLQAVL